MQRLILPVAFLALTIPGTLQASPELIDAILRRDVGAVDRLLRAGADPNFSAPSVNLGRTPLETAAKQVCGAEGPPGSSQHNGAGSAILQLLLEAGGKASDRGPRNDPVLVSAVITGDAACVRVLLAAGVNVNYKSIIGRTPLMTAVYFRRYRVVEVLLAAGADANLTDNAGRTAYDFALEIDMPEITGALERAMGRPSSSGGGGWDYLYVSTIRECVNAADFGASADSLKEQGCSVEITNARRNSTLLLNCKAHPVFQGYVWFARTLFACNWVRENFRDAP